MIELKNVCVRQGDFSLCDIELLVPSGTYGILMGPTGSGKTTLLEAICGLRELVRGSVTLDDRDVTHVQPCDRGIGYVPQDLALFPAMRVDRQIEFAMRVRGQQRSTRLDRIKELASLLDISHLLRRWPDGLSGGEAQRVALARALSVRPRLLCLDEPLSAVDEITRNRLMDLLKRVHEVEQVTALHVTHSGGEAQQLGTCIFELRDGIVRRKE